MSSFIVPDLFSQMSASEFFKEFIARNSSDEHFSQRSFSKKIGWPVSYIPDLVSGRRKFTIDRSLQLGNFLKLSPIDFEKLIYLAINDSCSSNGSLTRILALKTDDPGPTLKDEILMSPKPMLVFTIIAWLGKFATEEKITRLSAKRNVTSEEVGYILEALVAKERIKKEGDIYIRLVEDVTSFYPGGASIKSLREFADFYMLFLEAPASPTYTNSSLVVINESRFEEITSRINAFQTWVHEIALIDTAQNNAEDSRVYQLDLNFSLLTSKDDVKEYKSETDKK